jgi:hypothetical protein
MFIGWRSAFQRRSPGQMLPLANYLVDGLPRYDLGERDPLGWFSDSGGTLRCETKNLQQIKIGQKIKNPSCCNRQAEDNDPF